MSWIRSSKGALLAVLLAVSLLAAGTAAAYSVSIDGPDEAEAGSTVTYTATIEEPFPSGDSTAKWTLRGTTDLEQANWSVKTTNVGNPDGLAVGSGSQVSTPLSAANGTTEVTVEVTGVIPDVQNFNYANQANATAVTIQQRVGGSVQETNSKTVLLYTGESEAARTAIEDAETALAEGGSSEAENMLSNAKAFYDSGQFEKATQNAQDAQSAAESASSGLPIVPIVVAVVVLLVVVGGVYYWRQQQKTSSYKLQ